MKKNIKDGWHVIKGYDVWVEGGHVIRGTLDDEQGYRPAYPYKWTKDGALVIGTPSVEAFRRGPWELR